MFPRGSILVTGAFGGLGSAIVSELESSSYSSDQYHGIFTHRPSSPSNGDDVSRHAVPEPYMENPVHTTLAVDLSSLKSVRKLAKTINQYVQDGRWPPLKAIILNAALYEYGQQKQTFTPEGADKTFMVNYVANFLLVILLLPSMDRETGRIVFVSSWTHDVADIRNLWVYKTEHIEVGKHGLLLAIQNVHNGYMAEKGNKVGQGSHALRRYGASKLCMVMFMYELQRRLDANPALNNISVLCVDPGIMNTTILRKANLLSRFIFNFMFPFIGAVAEWVWPNSTFSSAVKSAKDVVFAVFDDNDGDDDGKKGLGKTPKAVYVAVGGKKVQPGAEARNEETQRMLWERSVEWAGLTEEEMHVAGVTGFKF